MDSRITNTIIAPSFQAMQNQLINDISETNLEQMESFDKTIQVFQVGLETIEKNMELHAIGFAKTVEQVTSLEGRADQLDIKLQTQAELKSKQQNALSERLKEIAAMTSRLQQEINFSDEQKLSDAKTMAEYENSYNPFFKEILEAKEQKELAEDLNRKNNETLETDVASLGQATGSEKLTKAKEKLATMDKDIDTLTNRYNGHSHHWGTYNDFTRCSYTNYSSGASI